MRLVRQRGIISRHPQTRSPRPSPCDINPCSDQVTSNADELAGGDPRRIPPPSLPLNARHCRKAANLVATIVAVFFLFTSGYNFPGGASHYPNWAEAIVNGTTLPLYVAQREVGLPLLYILSGFTIFHSFIGITLIYALFGI